MYQTGLGVPQDYNLAMEWYHKAASNKSARAQFYIGNMYQNGLGVSQDYILAMDWYMKAAQNGEPKAMGNIGVLYDNGQGVIRNIDIAAEWYKKAADHNHEMGKKALERLNEQGHHYNEGHKGNIYIYFFMKGSIVVFIIQTDEENTNIKNSESHGEINVIENEQVQPSSSTSNNDEHFNKLINDKMKSLQDDFQSKLELIENASKTTIRNLKKEQARKKEENRQLKEKLARLEAELNHNTNSDLNYDSPDTDSDNNDINYSTERSEDEDDNHKSNNMHRNHIKYALRESYANPNYNSSDNEDRTKDICYD